MDSPWFKFAAICSVVIGIVLFCMVFGGYSSYYRSESRIEGSKGYLTDNCQTRLDLVSELTTLLQDTADPDVMNQLRQAAEKSVPVLEAVKKEKKLLNQDLVTAFETSQAALTPKLRQVLELASTTSLAADRREQFQTLKKKIYTAQDMLFVEWKRYNKEASYFNRRTSVFPGFIIAKIFGFDEFRYIELEKDTFLPAHKAFPAES